MINQNNDAVLLTLEDYLYVPLNSDIVIEKSTFTIVRIYDEIYCNEQLIRKVMVR